MWGLGTLIEQVGHCQCGPKRRTEEQNPGSGGARTTGGEPLYPVPQDLATFAALRERLGNVESRWLPRITQRDALIPCIMFD